MACVSAAHCGAVALVLYSVYTYVSPAPSWQQRSLQATPAAATARWSRCATTVWTSTARATPSAEGSLRRSLRSLRELPQKQLPQRRLCGNAGAGAQPNAGSCRCPMEPPSARSSTGGRSRGCERSVLYCETSRRRRYSTTGGVVVCSSPVARWPRRARLPLRRAAGPSPSTRLGRPAQARVLR